MNGSNLDCQKSCAMTEMEGIVDSGGWMHWYCRFESCAESSVGRLARLSFFAIFRAAWCGCVREGVADAVSVVLRAEKDGR